MEQRLFSALYHNRKISIIDKLLSRLLPNAS